MRSKFILFLVVVTVLVAVAEMVSHDPGYLLLSYGPHVVETSLVIAMVLLALVVAAVLGSLVLLGKVLSVKSNMTGWLAARSARAARQKTTLGLIELAEGHWSKAQSLLGDAATELEDPLVNYLCAARAADELDDLEGRDEYLRLAHETKTGNPDLAVGLTRAQLHYQRKDWERCLATLQRLHEKAPKHAYVMKMLMKVYQETGEWERLCDLVPVVRKTKMCPYSQQELDALEMRGYERWLRSILKRKPAEMQQSEQLLSVWQRVPSGLRAEEQLVATYCECLAAVGEQGSASALLQQVLARSWSDRLVGLYGGLEHVSIKQSIEKAEGWLEAHPNSASLLLALGRLSMRNHQWDQAQQYFERSLAARVSVEVYGELGRLLAGRGKHEASNGYFQKGLGMLVNGLPDVPLPEPVAAD